MSHGPVLVKQINGSMRPIPNEPDVYGLTEKLEFLFRLGSVDLLYKKVCDCPDPGHVYGCVDPPAMRPRRVMDLRNKITDLNQLWGKVLDIMEADPDVYIDWY